MVQKSRTIMFFWSIVWRIFLLILIAIGSLFVQDPFYSFLINTLQYQEPPGFFGFNPYFLGLGWVLSWTFWSSVIYQTIGRKTDLYFILAIFIFSVWNIYATQNVTPMIYFGLIGVALAGNAIGFALKLLWVRYLVK